MSSKIIVGNWKQNPQSSSEATRLFTRTILDSKDTSKNISVVLCVPHLFIPLFSKIKTKKVQLGSQDVSVYNEGAHTGEVSSSMLASCKVSYCIVGHSEVRHSGDTDMDINTKILNLFKNNISPILCVGESVRDHKGDYLSLIKDQIQKSLTQVNKNQLKNLIIAYEPVWAIGDKALRECTTEEFIEIRIFIRKVLSDLYDMKTSQIVPILYGGSVHKENALSFVQDGGSDGLLVGRDSLDNKKFKEILYAIN